MPFPAEKITAFLVENADLFLWILFLFVFGKISLGYTARKIVALAQNRERAQTISSIITTSGNFLIYALIVLVILKLFNVDLGPFLAGVGIFGLAIGFGSQTLVKDFVSGLFILFEDQYTIGETVKIGGFEGEVVKMSIRSTVLKDKEGRLIFFSNSSVDTVVNYSRK